MEGDVRRGLTFTAKKKKKKNRWERGWPSLESRGREGQGNGVPPLHKLPLSWSSTFLDNLRAGGRRQRAVIVLDRYERENISLDFSLALRRRSIRGTLTVERSRVGDFSFSWEGGRRGSMLANTTPSKSNPCIIQ